MSEFQIRSDTPLTTDQTFNLRVFGSDNLIDHAQYFDFELSTNQRQSNLTIPTIDDEVFTSNGSMTLEILPSQDYAVALTNSNATIEIIDNDFLPGISIVAEQAIVTEGEVINFLD